MSVDRLVARGYGWGYDRLVDGFAPWEALVDELAARLDRLAAGLAPRRLRVLDVACGTGAVVRRLWAHGHDVVGIDPVEHLVDVAQRLSPPAGPVFAHADVARDDPPGAGTFDAVVSMHTYYWHPEPAPFLEGCRRALRPGGHAAFLTYVRPVRLGPDFRAVRRRRGIGPALAALRWLVPTVAFEALRRCERRYVDEAAFEAILSAAGFHVLDLHRAFLAEMSLVAWTQSGMGSVGPDRASDLLAGAGMGSGQHQTNVVVRGDLT